MHHLLRPNRLVSCGVLAFLFACTAKTSAPGGTALLDTVTGSDATDITPLDALSGSDADTPGDVVLTETGTCPTGSPCDDGDKWRGDAGDCGQGRRCLVRGGGRADEPRWGVRAGRDRALTS